VVMSELRDNLRDHLIRWRYEMRYTISQSKAAAPIQPTSTATTTLVPMVLLTGRTLRWYVTTGWRAVRAETSTKITMWTLQIWH